MERRTESSDLMAAADRLYSASPSMASFVEIVLTAITDSFLLESEIFYWTFQ